VPEIIPEMRRNPGNFLWTGAALVAAIGIAYLAICAAGRVQGSNDPPPWVCVGFVAAGLALAVEIRFRERSTPFVSVIAGIVLAAIGGTAVAEFIGRADFGVDAALFRASLLAVTTHPGRPATGMAFIFLLIGVGLLLMRQKWNVTVIAREITAVAAVTFSYFSLTGSLMSWLSGSRQHQTMLPATAALILVIALCILFHYPDGHLRSLLRNQGPGGVIARWLLPVVFVLPVGTSLIRVMGLRLHLFDTSGSGSVISSVDILVAILIVWRSSTQVLAVDRQRRAAEDALRASRDELDERVKVRTAELHKANLTLSTVIATSPLAICTVDSEGKVRERNAAAEAMSIGSDGEFSELIERALGGERVCSVSITRPFAQGSGMHVNVWAAPLAGDGGQSDGVLMMAADVSERTKLEAQMRETQKLESLGILAGGIAHDFNNLLTGVMGNASLALEILSAEDESRPLLNQVVTASERAAELTRQLLAYAGKGRFVMEDVNLSNLVREISALIHASIQRSVELRFETAEDLPAIEADASQMQQIIMNLVINGSEAIAESGTVTIATRTQEIDREYIERYLATDGVAPGLYVCLEVSDTGSGMDRETQERIFDPFFTTKFTGRGLGLAAVQGIVRSHKGALRIYSVVGQGTLFRLFFPASGRQETEHPEPRKEERLARETGTVLIIDDELLVAQVALGALSPLGYEVRTAGNGEEGLRLFSECYEQVRVVLLDLTMPGMNSREILARLKGIRAAVPVILSSGFSETDVLKNFDKEDIAGFLQKPYAAAQLREAVAMAVEGVRSGAPPLAVARGSERAL